MVELKKKENFNQIDWSLVQVREEKVNGGPRSISRTRYEIIMNNSKNDKNNDNDNSHK